MIAPLLTLVFAAVACVGSLFLSLGLGLKACPLCFYQRTFAFALVGVLAVGLSSEMDGRLNLLALPLALGGLGVAGFHVLLISTGKLECPDGIGGIGKAPHQALAAFVLVLLPIVYGLFVEAADVCLKPVPLLVAAAVGAGGVYGSICANPPPMKAAAPPGEGEKLETCRVPFAG